MNKTSERSHRHSNAKYSDRTTLKSDVQTNKMYGSSNHGKNLDRLNLERDVMFNKNTNLNSGVGEITGNSYDAGCGGTDRGLPMRSQYTIKKQAHDPNDHLDFNLFDDRPSKLNVKSFDPSDATDLVNNSNYADISTSMTKISSQVNPTVICSTGIDRLNNNLFYFLLDLLDGNNYIINGIGLYNLFASLYMSSSGQSEIEIKKFFDFPKKEILYNGLIKINDSIKDLDNMINIKNFMMIGNDVPYDTYYYDNIKDFCIFVKLDVTKPVQEANKMNTLVNRTLNNQNMKNSVTAENIINLQLMFLTATVIHPIWAVPFDNITSGTFYGYKEHIKCNFLQSISKSFGYYEDNDHQLLEINCHGNKLAMGILLHKNEMTADINDIKLHFYITHLKNSIIDETIIPLFKQDCKLRFNNSLKKIGLQSVFLNIDAPEFFPEGIVLQDVVQNVRIIVDNACKGSISSENNKGYRTNKKFIANKPYIYYFRCVRTNTLLFIGTYQ
jgi:serine protease inhibitor